MRLTLLLFSSILSISRTDANNATPSRSTDLELEKLAELMKVVLNSTDQLDPSDILRSLLKDPMPIKGFFRSPSKFNFNGNFSNLNVLGLKTVELNQVIANISGQFLTFSAIIPLVQVTGHQKVDGKIMWAEVNTNGGLHFNVSDVFISGRADLVHTPTGRLKIINIKAELEVGDINLEMEGISGFQATLLNFVTHELFDYMKDMLLDDVKEAMFTYANAELIKVPVQLANLEQDQKLIDAVITKANERIISDGHDPQVLPSYKRSVDKMFIQGEVEVTNALLHGLGTLRRTGVVVVLYTNRSIILQASFGYGNLSTNFNWAAKLIGLGPTGKAQITVTDTNMNVRLRIPLHREEAFHVESLEFERIGHIVTNLEGLGAVDSVSEILINLLSNIFKYELGNWITKTAKDTVEKEISQLDIDKIREQLDKV